VPSARDSESLARSPGVDGDARHGRKRRLALAAAVLALFGIVGTALALWRPWVDQRAQKDAEWRALLGGSTAAPPAARAGATAGVTQHSAATSGSGSAAGVSPIPKIPRLRAIADARMRDDDTPLAAVQKRAAGDPLVERKIFGGASPAALRDSLERRLDKTPGDRDLAARYAIALVASGAEKRGLARLAQLDREGGAAAASFVGYIALRRGDRAAAEKALLRAVSRAPKSVEARRNLGIVRRRMGKTRSAYHDLVAALRLDPSDRQALPELFRIYAHVGLAQRGRPLVERLLRIAPSRADGWAELAVLLADDPAADAQDGLRAARRAVALDPSEAHVQRALCIAAARAGVPRRAACAHAARFLSEDKRVAKLLASAEPASASSGSGSGSSSPTTTAPRTTDSDSAAPSGLRAVRPIKPSTLSNSDPPDKRYDQRARAGKLVPSHLLPNGPAAALRTIDARIKASPGDARFQVSRALILTALGRLKEANSLFAKLRREQPQLVDLWSMLGYLAMRRGKRHEAERLLTRAVKLDATRVDVLRNRAIVRRRLGRTRDAYTDLMGALRLRPADAEGLTELAAIYYKLDRVAEAAALLRRVAELKPFRAKVWIDLAVAEPDPKRAVRAARRAVALAPRSARAVRQLCRQLSEHGAGADGRWLEPIRICTRAAALAPGEPSVMMHRGLAHYHGRRLRAALADIDRAVHARPKHAQYRVNRAIVRQLAGDARGARQDLRAACRYGHAGACNKVKAHAH
ncbi:MAG: tetratricopeptide repeat protein, partial [Myxococcales bacterium]|nr:tetratricopeptide repeat protein [Myxococcales bacterium]